jgi:cytochrome P450
MAQSAPLFRSEVGMLTEIRSDPLALLDRMLAVGEPVLRSRIGPLVQLAVFDADLVRHVLSANANDYPRPFVVNRIFRDVSGTNLFTTTRGAWAWRRKALQPSFQRGPIEQLTQSVERFVSAEVAQLPAGRLADAQAWMASLTVSVAATALFSRSLTAPERAQLDGWFRDIATWTGNAVRTTVPVPKFVPTAANRKLKAALRGVRRWLLTLVAERRRQGVGSADVLDVLLSMTDPETSAVLADERIVDEAMVMLFAGYETTAAAATWAAAYLAERPDLQARLATGEAGLAERVADETLRLRPPAWGSVRMANKADVIGGYRVRRFTTVLVPIYAIHRHPRYWPDPERFDPDRFLPEQLKTRPPGAYLPFLVGPRHCIGMRLAVLELRLIIEHLCRRFEIAPVGPLEADATLALRVRDGLGLTLTARAA